MKKTKQLIYIRPDQKGKLVHIVNKLKGQPGAVSDGISISELCRRAIDHYLKSEKIMTLWWDYPESDDS